MKKIFLTIVVVLIACSAAFAVPARRGFVRHTQPDGSVIMLQKHGDEFCHWTTDASGRVVEKGADGYWRPADANRLEARKRVANIKRSARNHVRRSGSHIAVGQKRFLVILVEFSDVKFKSQTANQDFHNLLNENGYSANGGTGSARDYYYDNSHGYFEPIFDVYGPVTLSNDMAHYGGNDSNGYDLLPEQAVVEGCQALDEQIDFTKYDNDDDGVVDLVFMYYAGYGEADSDELDSIWPHQWELSSAGKLLTMDGKKIDSYACTNELYGSYSANTGSMCGIGTACHEFGHAMGLPDFYDTDYETNGQSAAMFSYSIMDSGAYNNNGRTPCYFTIEERIILGWLGTDAIQEFPAGGGPVELHSVDENIAYKTLTDKEGEYFVYECRNSSGWDAWLPANGLIVTHIDKSDRVVKLNGGSTTAYNLWDSWWSYNAINENGSHPCCYVIPAADQTDLLFGYIYYPDYGQYYYNESNNPLIPFPGSEKVTSFVPVSWNGVESGITLSDISYSNGVVAFNVKVPREDLDYPLISNPGQGSYSAGDSFQLQLEECDVCPVASVAWSFDDEPVAGSSVVLTAGWHTVEAVVTLADGGTLTLTLEVQAN